MYVQAMKALVNANPPLSLSSSTSRCTNFPVTSLISASPSQQCSFGKLFPFDEDDLAILTNNFSLINGFFLQELFYHEYATLRWVEYQS